MSTRTDPAFCTGQGAIFAKHDLTHVLGIADDCENDVGRLRHRPGRIQQLGPLFDQSFGLLGRAVKDRGTVTGCHQMPTHRRAHHSSSNPANPRFFGREFECHRRLRGDCVLVLGCGCPMIMLEIRSHLYPEAVEPCPGGFSCCSASRKSPVVMQSINPS